jgi:hypothetical protein
MRELEAKDFLVRQTAENAVLTNVSLSDLEKRMLYFSETGECPEDPIALSHAFEAEYDASTYEKKISLLMARAYRRIKRESPEKLRLWNDAFRVLSEGDHYILLFWQKNAFSRSPQMWPTYLLGACAVTGLCLVLHFFFGNRRSGGQAPVNNYIPTLSPLVQHTLQLLFLLALFSRSSPSFFPNWPAWRNDSFNQAHRLSDQSRVASRYLNPTSFSNSVSVKIVTPSSLALSYFEPGSAPTTT